MALTIGTLPVKVALPVSMGRGGNTYTLIETPDHLVMRQSEREGPIVEVLIPKALLAGAQDIVMAEYLAAKQSMPAEITRPSQLWQLAQKVVVANPKAIIEHYWEPGKQEGSIPPAEAQLCCVETLMEHRSDLLPLPDRCPKCQMPLDQGVKQAFYQAILQFMRAHQPKEGQEEGAPSQVA